MLRQFFNDERSDAERIFRNGFSEKEFRSYEAYLVAKYFRNELQYKNQRVKTSLITFCQNNDKVFNYILNRSTILSIVNNSKSEWKNKTSPIIITEKEVGAIRKIKSFNGQKILLAFAVFAKRDDGYVYHDRWSDIKRLTNIRMTNREIYKFLFNAYSLGLIRDSNQNHFVNFLDDNSKLAIIFKKETEILRLGEVYKTYLGGEIKYCKSCGNEFIKSGDNHKFCSNCSEDRRKEQIKNNVKKHREKEANIV